MHRTRVKICGIMRVADAIAAADAGADAIGLVFHPQSRRCISPEVAAGIVAALPPFVTPVALFVDADANTIRATCTPLGIRHVQLSGHESPDLVAELSQFTVTKAIRAEPATFTQTLTDWRNEIRSKNLQNLRGLILETPATQPGGTGQPNNWELILATKKAGQFDRLPPIIAAGGLRPKTVADVVRQLRPYAVDVSSGVEDRIGEKSPEKIRAFIDAVHQADR